MFMPAVLIENILALPIFPIFFGPILIKNRVQQFVLESHKSDG